MVELLHLLLREDGVPEVGLELLQGQLPVVWERRSGQRGEEERAAGTTTTVTGDSGLETFSSIQAVLLTVWWRYAGQLPDQKLPGSPDQNLIPVDVRKQDV